MLAASAFVSGLLFGLGLIVSQMINPAKVLAFLDVFGKWDPSLAVVMAGAVAASGLGYILARKSGTPLLAARFDIPSRRDCDARLIIGAFIFGAGWGMAGICPGPALVLLPIEPSSAFTFTAAMLAGMTVFYWVPQPRSPSAQIPSAKPTSS